MMKKMTFCEKCRDDVEFIVATTSMIGNIKGVNYNYYGKIAKCINCNEEVFVPEIIDYNLKALYDVYREKNGIISLDKILEIPKKYSIGKRPLSLLLGWGELTFSRYCDGDMPTKQYSDILSKIYDFPKYYEEILEANKERLKSENAYKKSRKALDDILACKEKTSKINDAIKYVLNECEDITPLSLQKALYYIQGFYFAFYNDFLFEEECEAWVHGPVFREVYFKYRDYHFDPIDIKKEPIDLSLTSSEKAIYDSVINYLCCYSGNILEQFTHNETPWLIARGDLSLTTPCNYVISKDSIKKYFVGVKDKYNMMNPNDIKSYALDMFNKI